MVDGEKSYLVVEVADGFDLAAQSIVSAFNINVFPLSFCRKLVVIGERERDHEVRRNKKI